MYIQKETEKMAKDKEIKKAIEKEPPQQKKKDELKGLPYADQKKKVQAREKTVQKTPQPEGPTQKDPVSDLKKLFRDHSLPDKLVPTNVVDFRFEPSTGALVIHLKSAFSKSFDAENTVSFDQVITGVLKDGSFEGITGITRGNANIVGITRIRPGVIGIRGKMGIFSKTLEFKDEQIPSLP